MSVYTTSSRPNELWAGLRAFWGDEEKKLAPIYTKIFKTGKSEQEYEKVSEHYNIGLVQVKSEGSSMSYGGFAQGSAPEFYQVGYALGFKMTLESKIFNKYFKEGEDKVRALRRSFYTSKELVHANILNNGFSSSQLMPNGDGKALLATDHPNAVGSYSNKLSVDADLTEVSLENLLIQIKSAYDSSGVHKAMLTPLALVVPDAQVFNAHRILKSVLQSDTANNDINAIRSMGLLPEGVIENTFLSDTDAWFVKTNADQGLLSLQSYLLQFDRDNEFDTKNECYSGTEFYSVGWANPRAIYGSQGS